MHGHRDAFIFESVAGIHMWSERADHAPDGAPGLAGVNQPPGFPKPAANFRAMDADEPCFPQRKKPADGCDGAPGHNHAGQAADFLQPPKKSEEPGSGACVLRSSGDGPERAVVIQKQNNPFGAAEARRHRR